MNIEFMSLREWTYIDSFIRARACVREKESKLEIFLAISPAVFALVKTGVHSQMVEGNISFE